MPLSHLLLELPVRAADPVDFLLLLHAFAGLSLNIILHLVDLGLPLPNVGLDFVHFLIQVVHGTLL